MRVSQPLLPGVLPSSLRELALCSSFTHPLQPGSLPDGLETLACSEESQYQQSLPLGVIPASVVVMSLGKWYRQELVAGGIPATVR